MSNRHSTSAKPGDYIEDVIRIAARASEEIVKIYNTFFTVENKEDDSPLTTADMVAHRTIMDGLQQLTPELPVLSEESSSIPFATRSQWSCYWLVDPLDGTREFIKRNGEFTVNIALIDLHEPVMGVVYLPVSGACYYAARGPGAFRLQPDGKPEKLGTRTTLPGSISAAGSRSHGSERQVRFFEALGPGAEIITAGSSLKFCLVAEGKVDIYPRFGPTSEWDTAAAQCIVEEAGGSVTDLRLRPLRYNCKESLINPEFLVIGDPGFDWSSVLAMADVLPESEE
jgi:3'(2'), 5'-bisphosphate nucleotidase